MTRAVPEVTQVHVEPARSEPEVVAVSGVVSVPVVVHVHIVGTLSDPDVIQHIHSGLLQRLNPFPLE